MNTLVFSLSFLLLAAVTHICAATQCDPNEVLCELYDPSSLECGPKCLSGCPCQKGHVVYDGVCIPKEKCPPVCSGNKTFQSLNIYVRTCDKININPKRPGCYCKEGYVLNRHTHECVLPEDCPKKLNCYARELKDDCITPCPATCLNPNPPICTVKRCEEGCACKPPFIRDTESGYCVKPKKCPDPCPGKHEEYNECGTACESFCGYIPQACTKNCVSGCFCKPGYIRKCASKQSRCIPVEACPSKKF